LIFFLGFPHTFLVSGTLMKLLLPGYGAVYLLLDALHSWMISLDLLLRVSAHVSGFYLYVQEAAATCCCLAMAPLISCLMPGYGAVNLLFDAWL
jgi:hypothetical protein